MKYVNSYHKDLRVKSHLCETNITNKDVFLPGLSKDQIVIFFFLPHLRKKPYVEKSLTFKS